VGGSLFEGHDVVLPNRYRDPNLVERRLYTALGAEQGATAADERSIASAARTG
jgi:hypothetical protein